MSQQFSVRELEQKFGIMFPVKAGDLIPIIVFYQSDHTNELRFLLLVRDILINGMLL